MPRRIPRNMLPLLTLSGVGKRRIRILRHAARARLHHRLKQHVSIDTICICIPHAIIGPAYRSRLKRARPWTCARVSDPGRLVGAAPPPDFDESHLILLTSGGGEWVSFLCSGDCLNRPGSEVKAARRLQMPRRSTGTSAGLHRERRSRNTPDMPCPWVTVAPVEQRLSMTCL